MKAFLNILIELENENRTIYSVSRVVTGLPTGQARGITFRLPAVLIYYSLLAKVNWFWGQPVTYSMFIRDKGVGINLTTHLHLVDSSRISWDISQLSYMRTGIDRGRYYCHFHFRQNLHLHSISIAPAISMKWWTTSCISHQYLKVVIFSRFLCLNCIN